MDDIELGTYKFQKDWSILCRIPNPADSKSWGFPEFWKILNGVGGIPIKIHKIQGEFMEFQSGSPSIYCRISNVVHGVCVDIFWTSPIYRANAVEMVEHVVVKLKRHLLQHLLVCQS